MKAKKRILVFPFDLLSHYLRCIVLMNNTYNRDEYEILFLSSSTYNPYLTEHGYNNFEAEQFDSKEVIACSEKFDFSWLNYRDLERILLSQIDVIRRLEPDIVIGDVAPSLKMAAEITNVKYIALTNGYMTKHYAYTRKLSRTHPAYKYSKMVSEKCFNVITSFAESISFKIVHRPFKKLRKKYALKRISNYLLELEGDENLICDDTNLFPQEKISDKYKLIGPLVYKVDKKEGVWLQDVSNEKPIIFICMGSSGNWKALNFLNNESYNQYTIITAGDTEKELYAEHIVSRNFVNIEDVLNISDLMICHGGNGTIYHGLMKGVYMLCLTSHFEQEWNVHSLERVGYGCSANDFTNKDWDTMIGEQLNLKLEPIKFF